MLAVLHVLSSLKLGGAERITMELAKHQREQAMDAQILNLGSEDDFLVAIAQDHGIPITVSEVGSSRSARYAQINNLFKKFDVVHIHSPLALRFVAPLLPLHNKVRFIYTRHGLNPLKGFNWKMLHLFARPFFYKTTFVTQSGREVFKKAFNWPEHKTVVIENGVHIPTGVVRSSNYPIRFGSVGRMITLKGQKNLLDAVAGLCGELDNQAKEMFELHFYGSGPLEADLKSQAAELKDASIIFHGEVSDIASIYKNLDVLIVASESEGLSMVIIEAMARGIPVIATNVGGNPTLVFQDKSGILVEYGDIASLQNAMHAFIRNPDYIHTYGMAAREYIASKFSIEKTHRAYLAQYQE